MSSLICFPNKLAKPAVRSEFAFGSNPAVDGAVDFMGASCPADPGSEDCGKRLSGSLWASEDLCCGSEIRRDDGGSPERPGAADSQRAISLDASECLSEMSSLSGVALVRSAALEDLTSIGDRSFGVSQGEDGARNVPTESLSHFQSEDVQNISEKAGLLPKMPSDIENSSSDSWPHRAACSQPDISNDSDMSVAQTAGTAELQRTPPQSSAARKSLVPVAMFKGLFLSCSPVQSPPQFSTSFCF